MKVIIAKASIIVLMLSLAGCATNTQEQNTLLGAGTGAVAGGLIGSLGSGWAIAAGAIVGAVIGGYVGHSMDSRDTVYTNTALVNNSINVPSKWHNNKTGVWYKIVPTSDVFAYKGSTYCRHYVAYSRYKGKTQKTKGVACRSQNDMWEQIL